MKLNGFKKEYVEIEYIGSHADLIDNIFKDLCGFSIKEDVGQIKFEEEQIIFNRDDSMHGSSLYETVKIINKNDNECLFITLTNLYLIYYNLLKLGREK